MMNLTKNILAGDIRAAARLMRGIEDGAASAIDELNNLYQHTGKACVVGITGAPGAGKSTLADALISAFRKREMTVGQMAKELDITSQATYHHVKKLLNGKMIEIVREVRVGHIMENHYRATADEIILSHGKTDTEALQHAVRLATSKR